MIVRIVFTILLFCSIVFEATLLPFPLVFLFSFLYFVFFEDVVSFVTIFICAVLLDALLLHNIGYTALFLFFLFCMLIFTEKLLTIRLSAWVIGAASIIGVELYRQYAHYPFLIVPEIVFMVSILAFMILERRLTKKGGGNEIQTR